MDEYYRQITTSLPPQFEQALNDVSANEPDKEKDSFRQKVMEGRDIKPIPTYHEIKAKLKQGEENLMNTQFPTVQHAVKDMTHLVPPRPVIWESLGETEMPRGDQGENRNGVLGTDMNKDEESSAFKQNGACRNGNDFSERCPYTTHTFPISSGMEEWEPNYESDSSSDFPPDTPLPSQKGSESGKKEKEDLLLSGKRGQEIGWSGATKFRRLSNGIKATDETTDSEHSMVEVAKDADGADRCQFDTVADAAPGQDNDAAPGQDNGHRVGAPESGREDSKANYSVLKQQMKMAVEDSFSAAVAHIRPVDEDDQMRDALYFKFLDDIFRAWHHFSFSSATLYTALSIYTKIVELRPYLRLVILKICAPASLTVAARRCGKFYDHEAFWKVWRGGNAFRERLSVVEEQIELLLEPQGILFPGLSPHYEINKILTKEGINITVPQYCCALFYFDRSFCKRKNIRLTYEERAKCAIDLCFQEVDEIQADMRDMNSDIYCHNHIVKREGFLSKWRDVLEEYANMDLDTIYAFEYFLYKKEYENGRFPATPARKRKRAKKDKDLNTQTSASGPGLTTTIVECIDLTENLGPEPSPLMLKLINEEYWT